MEQQAKRLVGRIRIMHVLEIETANIALSPAANIAINIGLCSVDSYLCTYLDIRMYL